MKAGEGAGEAKTELAGDSDWSLGEVKK